jgi:hypothetical protein
MLLPAYPIVYRKRAARVGRAKQANPPAPPGALTLVSATYELAGPSVALTFDRAIDAAGLVANQIVVDDALNTQMRWRGTGAAIVLGPAAIRVNLEFVEDIGGAGVVLTAGAGNGIVAVGDGAAWAGASDVELPFP